MSIFVLWVLVSTGYGGTVYKWVDKDGVVNFTDDYTQIPPQYRNQVQMEELGESLKAETPSSSPVSIQESERGKVDIYGTGEDYWRAKAQPWKKQLQEATENRERINRKILDKTKEQGGKFLSPTQLDMMRAEIAQLKDERSKSEAQIREANEMLNKIVKEAEDAKADPQWIK